MRKLKDVGVLGCWGVGVLVAIGMAVGLVGCGSVGFRTNDGMVWNTTYHIVYEGEDDMRDSIMAILREVENSVSFFNDSSIVSKVNRHKEFEVDGHFRKVYEMSREIYTKTNGMFDPSLGPLIEAWGFGKGHEPTADTLRIDSLLAMVGIDKTRLNGNSLIKENENTRFNFSALAKGYGVDCVAEMFMRNGIENFLIEIGGEIRCLGHNSRNQDWTISIDSPSEGDMNLLHVSITEIRLRAGAVATSGNYRNYHETASGRYGHTISPESGRPIKTNVLSATVIAETAMLADALATSCMAMGSEGAFSLCDEMNCAAMLVLDDLSVVTNEKFKSFLIGQTSEPGRGDQN